MEIKGDGNILPQSNIKDVITDNFMHDVIDASKLKPVIVDFGRHGASRVNN